MIYDEFKESNQKTLNHLENELIKIRAGKASPAMLNSVMVEYYGSMTPLQQVANVNTMDARTIIVQPWEKPLLNGIMNIVRIAAQLRANGLQVFQQMGFIIMIAGNNK